MAKIAAVIGCGTIGAGWIARLLFSGWSVRAFDSNQESLQALAPSIDQARLAWVDLHGAPTREGTLTLSDSLQQCVATAPVVIESLPENLALKQSLYRQIETLAPSDCWILSSTSGFKPTDLGAELKHPERLLVCHPFNPVYLIPLAEVVAHSACSMTTTQACMAFLQGLHMHPLLVRKEIDGHIADRLLEAMWREALWLIHDEVATTAEIDAAIKHGFGLRMAQMGLFETYRLGGGADGFGAFLAQFGPALQWPWSHLTDVPELNQALIDKIVTQSDHQTGQASHAQRVAERDRKLVATLRALQPPTKP